MLRDPARGLPLPHDGEQDLPPAPLSEETVEAVLRELPRASVLDLRNVCLLELRMIELRRVPGQAPIEMIGTRAAAGYSHCATRAMRCLSTSSSENDDLEISRAR